MLVATNKSEILPRDVEGTVPYEHTPIVSKFCENLRRTTYTREIKKQKTVAKSCEIGYTIGVCGGSR